MNLPFAADPACSRRQLLKCLAAGFSTTSLLSTQVSVFGSDRIAEGQVLAFSYFVDNGQDGLHLLWSEDGLAWQSVRGGDSLLTPHVGSKLMRDPCVVPGPDGDYHMVWTTGWWDSGFGYARTKDFRTWTDQRYIPIIATVPGAKNTWAPELTWDEKTKTWWIVWATTIPGKFPATDGDGDHNHRLYATRTQDFVKYSEPELLFDPGYNCIDATFVHLPDQVILVFKDERLGKKTLQVAIAPRMAGPYQTILPPFTGDWVEGPTVVSFAGAWWLYCDHYSAPQHYQLFRTTDFRSWENLTTKLRFPAGVRHGSAFLVARSLVENLQSR